MVKKKKTLEEIYSLYDQSKIYRFTTQDHLIVLIGYPYWKAYIILQEYDVKIEVYPQVNLTTSEIDLLNPEKIKSTELSESINNCDEELTLKNLEVANNLKSFFQTIPADIYNTASMFPDSQWDIIKALILYGDKYKSLINTNPALAYLTVHLDKMNHSYSCYGGIKYVEGLITTKQRQILEMAGFPGTERMVRIFSKIDVNLLNLRNLNNLRNLFASEVAMRDRILKLLSHKNTNNKNLFFIIINSPQVLNLLTNKALLELVGLDDYKSKLDVIIELSEEAQRWKIKTQLDTLSKLEKSRKLLAEKIKIEKEKKSNFPEPPVCGNEYVLPLRTPDEQIKWGQRQRNCISNYISNVLTRKRYFYKVTYNGEEATLEILTDKDKMRLGRLLGFKNRNVSDKLEYIVKEWFKNNYLSSN